ncbi:hypothetical protein [Rheinheimera nanhaiensis]|uniref:hypothetical protein n=1 Tax=Rheinheimera nanhaiensis TaxID=1163621 RepID=UPI0011D1E4A9|nr:hypothetical protein [Rheinheimera nanhaiensis]
MKKKYFNPDLSKGYPAGKKIRYQCGLCAGEIDSLPEHYACCECGNICIDADSARVTVKNSEKIAFYRY